MNTFQDSSTLFTATAQQRYCLAQTAMLPSLDNKIVKAWQQIKIYFLKM
ncbi:hypothetical protein HMPREF3034_01504 [Prevotella sp. DNF00663]|nr:MULTISPECIES: hypothetical protein [unclassified Prevotella]KXB82753.1 hypothetical protein HMPREF3034_01504 [Prevotella sp. DNF00663]